MEVEWFPAEKGFRNRRQRRRRRERAYRASGSALRTSGYENPKEERNDLGIDSDSSSSNSFKDENTALQSAHDSTCVKPTEKHMDQNLSNEAEIRWSSPSIIAKLMGLDEQPAAQVIHKHRKTVNGYFQERSTVGLKDKCQMKAARPTWMGTAEHQRFKDVYEVASIPKVEGDTRQLRDKKLLCLEQYKLDATKQHKADIRFASQKFIDAKHFPRNASLRFSKKSNNELGHQDFHRHHYPKAFQEPNFSFRKYFRDLKWLAPSHLTSKIPIFKSSKAAKTESGEVCCSLEKKIDRSNDLHKSVVSNFRKPINATVRHSPEEHRSNNLEKLQSVGNNPYLQPKHIVVLKPSVEKNCCKGRQILNRNPENVQSANRRLTSQSRFQEPHIGKRPIFSHSMEDFDHSNKGSRETVSWITEQLKECTSSNENFLPDESSCILHGMNCLCNSEAFWRSPNHFNDRNVTRGPFFSSLNENSRELGKKLSGKWKMNEHSKGVGDYANGSNTLVGMFDISDLEAQNVALDSEMVLTASDEISTLNGIRSSWGSPSSISSRESWEDGFFINLPKTTALTTSPTTYRSRNFSGISQDGYEHFYPFNNALRWKPKKFDRRGNSSLISIKSGNHKLHSKNSGEETPEVHSKLLSVPRATDVDRLMITNKMLKQMPMAELTSENSEVSRRDVEEASVCNQVDSKQLVPASISIHRTPPKEDNSGYSESLISDHLELHTKTSSSESVGSCAKVSEPHEDDGEDDYQTLDLEVDFIDEEERDYTYLLDILIVSGVHGAQQDRLLNACYSSEYPVRPSLFERLEKKYAKVVAWSRSERKLMFDLTNLILAEILAPCTSMHPWVDKTKRLRPMWGSEGLLEKTWQMLEGRRIKNNVANAVDKVVELRWLDLRGKIDEVGLEIERMLREDLLDELHAELISFDKNVVL